jgi:2-polyprenyl-3-methyl-5-hydroxy-6-metoxy-1,4-benzoquinol methylase
MVAEGTLTDYAWTQQIPHSEAYLLGPLQQLLKELAPPAAQVLDLGCGNGALAAQLARWGYRPIGVDPSSSGIYQAKALLPEVAFHQASAIPEELASLDLPPFDVVVSTEVVEHVYSPRHWAAAAFSALKPGGILICSTPYHGYLKNCALGVC